MDRNMEAELAGEFEQENENELEQELEFEHEGESEYESELESHEFEQELELEGEGEGEQFLGSIVSGLGSLLGGAGESEGESEAEFEQELEFEQGEQFFGKLLKKVARMAAPIVGKVVSGALPGPFGALANQGIQGLAGMIRESEGEFEFEQEFEQELGEHEVSNELGENELMAEALAHFAAQAEHELEAEAMVGAAVTITLSPRDRRALRRLVPDLVRGAAILARILRMRRATRHLVKLLPSIARRSAKALRRGAAAGQPINRKRAGVIMARQTRRVLSSPKYCKAALRRNARAARVAVRPVAAVRRPRTK